MAPRSKRWLLPLVVVLVWLFVGGPLGSFAGKLAEVQQNDNSAFLPQSAESTRTLEELQRFQDSESFPTTVVFERKGGLRDSDRSAVAAYAEELKGLKAAQVIGVAGPIPAQDGEAAQLVVQSSATDGDAVTASVDAIRATVADPPAGLTALVGGQGGILGDFIVAFGAIDGILLLVALLVVLVILLVVYRSPVLPLVVLFSAILALGVASAAIYALAKADLLALSGQSQGILFILAVGAATDYSLLVVARFREELRDHESKYDAMRAAYRASLEPVVASGLTVILGLLCLLLSDLASLRGLGPIGAFGVAGAMLSSLTLLPATLLLLGRKAFWPFAPHFGSGHSDATGIWARVADLVGRRARTVWVGTSVVLLVFAGFALTLNEDPVPQTDLFLTEVESVKAQDVIDAHFEQDPSSPAQVIVAADKAADAVRVLEADPEVVKGAVVPLPAAPGGAGVEPKVVDGEVVLFATLRDNADSQPSTDAVERLRTSLDAVSPDILVGGSSAILLDTRTTVDRDRAVVIPAILLVIFVVLALLLRSLVAPLLLLAANVLSFAATLGVSALVFNHVFDFPASDPSTPLIGFVFLVALGIDYSIFLMTRVREETLRRGTRPGILKGLSVTGGVITSAGVVLASTFAALGVVPILFLAQIAFIVAFGVLLDTFVVRSLLVPALGHDVGRVIWWPSRLARADETDAEGAGPTPVENLGGQHRA